MNQPPKNKVKGYLLLFAIFVVAPFGVLAIVWKDRCKETRVAEFPSDVPGLIAAIITTDCGTAMKVATELRIERHEGDKTVAHGTVLLLAGTPDLPVTWSAGPKLSVDVPVGIDVVKYRRQWENVTVAATIPPKKDEQSK